MTTPTTPDASAHRRRDAAATAQLLLDAARRRFAINGYIATTVREISDDAEVNVALVHRYFGSKEGLFQACLVDAAHNLHQSVEVEMSVIEFAQTTAAHLADYNDQLADRLRLLLRSSGEEVTERIRLGVLRDYADRLADCVGLAPGRQVDEARLLRAQIVLATILGLVAVKSATAIEPLATADQKAMVGPLAEVFGALLG